MGEILKHVMSNAIAIYSNHTTLPGSPRLRFKAECACVARPTVFTICWILSLTQLHVLHFDIFCNGSNQTQGHNLHIAGGKGQKRPHVVHPLAAIPPPPPAVRPYAALQQEQQEQQAYAALEQEQKEQQEVEDYVGHDPLQAYSTQNGILMVLGGPKRYDIKMVFKWFLRVQKSMLKNSVRKGMLKKWSLNGVSMAEGH